MTSEMGDIIQDRTFVYGSGDEVISVLLLKQEIGHGLIGMISSKLFDGNVALVEIQGQPNDDDFDIAFHGHSADGKAERIGMETALIDGLRAETDESLFVLFHELGHLVNGDAIAVGEAFEEYMQDRKSLVDEGKVLDVELRADDFAAKYFGNQAVISGLYSLIEREKGYYSPDDYEQADIEVMLNEMLLRIEYQKSKIEKTAGQ